MRTVLEMATPADAIETTGEAHYGVHVCWIGEDSEYIIAVGHVDERRFLAACCKLSRVEGGLVNPWDSPGMTAEDAYAAVKYVMASFDPKPSDPGASWSVWWGESAPQPRYPLTVLELL